MHNTKRKEKRERENARNARTKRTMKPAIATLTDDVHAASSWLHEKPTLITKKMMQRNSPNRPGSGFKPTSCHHFHVNSGD